MENGVKLWENGVMEKSSKTKEKLSKTMEKSSKTTEKLNKTMQESSKTMENRGKWFAVGGAFGEALDTLESKGVLKQLLSVVGLCSCRLVFVGLRCGTIMRKRHCLMVRPRRCIWGGDRETGIEGRQRKRHCLMVTRIRSNFCQ